MKNSLLLITCTLLFAGCTVRPPSIAIESPIKIHTDDVIEYDDGHKHKNKRFCPPGQAKKGNC
ncbi:MAG: hypothetical protein GQ569_14215 [Methylococcaceae bacterium]|nr:hypothetical protein [Methylococcaceae bacterium]